MTDRSFLSILVLSLSMIVAGWLIGKGFARGRTADRYVTVKGVAEREVKANLALWPIRFSAIAQDPSKAQSQIDRNIQQTREFLTRQGIPADQTELQGLRVNEMFDYSRPGSVVRYMVIQTLMVRSNDPDTILEASQKVGELVNAGVALTSGQEYGAGGPTFLFTLLNDLKPEMIAEATARAREAAQQFAEDSESELSGIRRANQGLFVILPRDQAPGIQQENQLFKTVRVVSTIEYLLTD